MEVTMCTKQANNLPLQTMGQGFVNPQLNTVWILALYFIMPMKWPCIGYLVDIGASGWLLYGTMIRRSILNQTHWMADICAALYADEHTVYQFLAISLVCWVASCILECRSLRFLLTIPLGDVRKMSRKSILLCFTALLASINSCWVMYNYSIQVHKSFEFVSQDWWVLCYFLLATLSKNSRVLFQGFIFTTRVGQSWEFLRRSDTNRRYVMSRMAFSNFIMLLQSVILLCWTRHWNTMTLLSVFDIIYHFIVILWFVANSSVFTVKVVHESLEVEQNNSDEQHEQDTEQSTDSDEQHEQDTEQSTDSDYEHILNEGNPDTEETCHVVEVGGETEQLQNNENQDEIVTDVQDDWNDNKACELTLHNMHHVKITTGHTQCDFLAESDTASQCQRDTISDYEHFSYNYVPDN